MNEHRKIVGPDHPDDSGIEQFGALVRNGVMRANAKTLADQLRKATLTDGPWLLYPDGTVVAHDEPYETDAFTVCQRSHDD